MKNIKVIFLTMMVMAALVVSAQNRNDVIQVVPSQVISEPLIQTELLKDVTPKTEDIVMPASSVRQNPYSGSAKMTTQITTTSTHSMTDNRIQFVEPSKVEVIQNVNVTKNDKPKN